MANFKLSSVNDKQNWSRKYTQEYVRESGFLPYMSTSATAIIRMDKSLGQTAGSTIRFTYFKRLSGAGVAGSATLVGNEENLANYGTAVRVAHVRNAVAVPESESFRTEIDVADVARDSLKSWSAEKLRDDLITAAHSIVIKGGNDTDGNPVEDTYKTWAAASAAEKNAHLVNNTDRILFGSALANSSSGVMATALATVAASQKLSAGVLQMAKTMARKTSPFKIRPFTSDATAGREYYVLFVGSEGFRDLQNDATIAAANKDARPRDVETNPIFQSGDLIYNGIIIREIPEIPVVGNVGASSAQVGQAFLCGQGALAVAYARMPEPRLNKLDNDHLIGVGITEIRGQVKMSAAGVQTGMVTLFHAAASDA